VQLAVSGSYARFVLLYKACDVGDRHVINSVAWLLSILIFSAKSNVLINALSYSWVAIP